MISHLLSYLPSKLPQGMTQFDAWSKSVIALTALPDNDSIRYTLASLILHSQFESDRVPKRYFVVRLNNAASREVAGNAFQTLYEAKKKRHQEEEAANKAVQALPQQEPQPQPTSNVLELKQP